ncbi:MLO-like protein 3 [Actinidia eriantha]|uniref:MLO-like protein 3 n=1 Tax=Actinidia eriantha TaxID=165200 RepID=UPI0025857319|nr:MLO-like protein 3 [Actinidia eriantha]
MAGGDGGGKAATPPTTRSLQETPTWALATVCFIFIFGGLLIEHLIHLLGHWLSKRRKNALFEAVERLKSVLMLLGFLSLLLAVTQRPISKICIPNRVANKFLPCRKGVETKTTKALGSYDPVWTDTFEPWTTFEDDTQRSHWERQLAADSSSDHCASKGMTSLMSIQGTNQLSIFIFVLAVMQIVYSVLTMALGRAKMRRWKAWERETQTVEYLAANDPNRFRFARQTTFGRRHMSDCATTPLLLWVKCFFRQFFHSVAKVDYLTLRHGFISAHLSTSKTFNFQKYIQRSLEDDFKVVVGISPFMWLLVVVFLLVDVHGWNVYLWVSFLPLITVLALGTKLEIIVAKMALQLKDQHSVIKGAPVVEPNDNLFWFGHPHFVLTLIHYILFMNAFELAFFVWVTVQFGFHSCYHERIEIIVIRVVLAVMVQVLCSYITLPLYALVTQMGTHFKSAVLEEETANVIRQWHAGVKDKRKKGKLSPSTRGEDSTSVWSRSNSPDISSHHRSPTLSEFASHHPEVTETATRDNDQIVPEDRRQARVNEVRIELPEITKAAS